MIKLSFIAMFIQTIIYKITYICRKNIALGTQEMLVFSCARFGPLMMPRAVHLAGIYPHSLRGHSATKSIRSNLPLQF